ncbi:MAG: hypothetical protein PHD97_06805 [Bacteroidales bacterium]|nr:hypothetical protein [Bacteroidales bacterium]
MTKKTIHILIWVTVFAVAMALLETAVVVYLRKIYYPGGFNFPLRIIEKDIMMVELSREFATIIMLISIGILAGRTKSEKFAYFLFSFAIWDIFYYVFLKIFINWPESLLTWDILFLIPTVWVGPVIVPCINSLTMIILAISIIYFTDKKIKTKFGLIVWTLLIAGSLIILFVYVQDYTTYMTSHFKFSQLLKQEKENEIIEVASKYIPLKFNWFLFFIGIAMHISAILIYIKSPKSTHIE